MDSAPAPAHAMPFGAERTADGRIRFRLWAPSATCVELCLEEGNAWRAAVMEADGDGWFALTTADATGGTRYRYRINGELQVPDPASRFQPEGVNGPSQVVDAADYRWQNEWQGSPWERAVVYELHVGTFTRGGTFETAGERLSYLAELGITAIEVMPVAAFAGSRNWGYDGVLPFAPHAAYGGPDAFRAFVDRAHGLGIMVLLDVVYNHFGPEGNYLHTYASPFFTDRHQTPWGDAINFDGSRSRTVRDFFVHNALYWLEEFRLDGLRLDAVHAIIDHSEPDILVELADAVHSGPGRLRPIHLVLENHDNEARYLRTGNRARPPYAAQWNDDYHHACHVLLTGESDGYYNDYADKPLEHLLRCLSSGFAWQGEESRFANGRRRGEPSGDLPLIRFIAFLQNHDQVGNRAFGERLSMLVPERALRAATSVMLLSPAVPGLFMGEEFGCRQPFLYFADFEGELAAAVRSGRKREFASFRQFADGGAGTEPPDPIDAGTFQRSVLQWDTLSQPEHAAWHGFYRELLDLRRRFIAPGLPASPAPAAETIDGSGLRVTWRMQTGAELTLLANLSAKPLGLGPDLATSGKLLHAEPADVAACFERGELPAWSVIWQLDSET